MCWGVLTIGACDFMINVTLSLGWTKYLHESEPALKFLEPVKNKKLKLNLAKNCAHFALQELRFLQ